MKNTTPTESASWFRHRMVWLVIAIPTLTVAGCLLTIYLAISRPHELISDLPPVGDTATTPDH